MKDNFEIEIREDGTIRMMYQDGVEKMAEEMGGSITTSCRASDVEWEELSTPRSPGFVLKGWSVRSAHNKELALREELIGDSRKIICSTDSKWDVAIFETREAALKWEVKFFWELLAPKHEGNNGG